MDCMQNSTLQVIRAKYTSLEPVLDERARRLWAGAEARAIGRGGITRVAQATGLSRVTVRAGLKDRAAASRCEFRVDWGPVSEYALMLLYSPTSRWFSRFLSYGVAHGESRIGFFSATLPGPSGPASGADPKTSVDQHRLRERLWRSFRCQFVRWNS